MAASLLRRDKKSTAAHLKADLKRNDNSSGLRQLQELLDSVLNAERGSDPEALEWCKWLLAGGDGFDDFCRTVRSYDNATLCGLVWTANFVAYRCRTCGISPCMSLCAECFNNGDHTGHDFNMFRSQAGGPVTAGTGSDERERVSRHSQIDRGCVSNPRQWAVYLDSVKGASEPAQIWASYYRRLGAAKSAAFLEIIMWNPASCLSRHYYYYYYYIIEHHNTSISQLWPWTTKPVIRSIFGNWDL